MPRGVRLPCALCNSVERRCLPTGCRPPSRVASGLTSHEYHRVCTRPPGAARAGSSDMSFDESQGVGFARDRSCCEPSDRTWQPSARGWSETRVAQMPTALLCCAEPMYRSSQHNSRRHLLRVHRARRSNASRLACRLCPLSAASVSCPLPAPSRSHHLVHHALYHPLPGPGACREAGRLTVCEAQRGALRTLHPLACAPLGLHACDFPRRARLRLAPLARSLARPLPIVLVSRHTHSARCVR